MVTPAIIKLINETQPHGVFDDPGETTVSVKAEVRSVSFREFYAAASAGITPELIFRMTNTGDYNGQKVFVYNGERWRVIRTYTKGQTLEITAGRATNDR